MGTSLQYSRAYPWPRSTEPTPVATHDPKRQREAAVILQGEARRVCGLPGALGQPGGDGPIGRGHDGAAVAAGGVLGGGRRCRRCPLHHGCANTATPQLCD